MRSLTSPCVNPASFRALMRRSRKAVYAFWYALSFGFTLSQV